jgi:sporulation protein YlmC with PRC-barrel domain
VLGTPVRCSDASLGELADVVIDPTKRRVTHLVVAPEAKQGLFGSRLIPIELASAEEAGQEIRLDCGIEDVRKLEPVEEVTYLRLGAFPLEDPEWDMGVSDALALPYYGLGEPALTNYAGDVEMTYDRIPKDEVEIRRASIVTSSDEHDLGRVEAFILDDEDHVTHLVLEHGHLWGRKDVTIPVGAVSKIETDRVFVGLTKDEVAALPTVHVKRWQ